MSISVNTNMSAITAQNSLNSSTNKMNTAMERLSTGLRINSSKDDAAGLAVSTKLDYQIGSLTVAKSNAQMGTSLLDTQEGVLDVISDNLSRIRDLTEQAANGTYATDSREPIKLEVQARLEEITRIANCAQFNGIYVLNGSVNHDVNLQVGINSDENSVIVLPQSLFASAETSALFKGYVTDPVTPEKICDKAYASDESAHDFLATIDNAIKNITDRITTVGGTQQRLTSAIDSTVVMSDSMTSANSSIKDCDMASESTAYVQSQILQQISTSMLTTANQSSQIALSLLG